MLEVIAIIVYCVYRSKRNSARRYGDQTDFQHYAKRAKVWGWIAVVLVTLDAILTVALISSMSSSTY